MTMWQYTIFTQQAILHIIKVRDLMTKNQKIERMKELIPILDAAARAYYQKDEEIMSNKEYDELYDELERLEQETGTVLSGSLTVRVGYEVSESLPKENHESPMLSLAKTKDRQELRSWLMGHEALLSWKMDGLTVVLTYENGELIKAVTRGNGEIGEVITNNAYNFVHVPKRISFKGKLVLRGEAVISYADFEKINSEIVDAEDKYKNPRNLCSGSVRQLDPMVTKKRNVHFIAFALVTAEGAEFNNRRSAQFEFLKEQGFEVVEYRLVNESSILDAVEGFAQSIEKNAFPSDGLVLLYEDIAYGDSLGRTAKAPRNAIAFKWADETAITHIREIEWSPSRTGLINPVAVFDPVELEGTTVTRASVHNVSIVKELSLGVGDEIKVYKANMIIPQIAENLSRTGTFEIPEVCPACGGKCIVQSVNESQSLICINEECSAKQIKAFALFVSRDALNIDGLSEQTLEKLIAKGFIREIADIYNLRRFAGEIAGMEGFGQKSMEKLLDSIEASRNTVLHRFIYGLGIPGFGVAGAKLICRYFDEDYDRIKAASLEELASIDGIGSVMAGDFRSYFDNEKKLLAADNIYSQLRIEKSQQVDNSSPLSGKTFVVTGTVETFENRNALKAFIEERGGKVTGSVTSKTDYLINNDTESSSSKNKKAKELNIPILSEAAFHELAGE